jgi:hypothetical protein
MTTLFEVVEGFVMGGGEVRPRANEANSIVTGLGAILLRINAFIITRPGSVASRATKDTTI